MKKNILFILLALYTNFIHAQFLSEFASNEMKYWKLRGRFTGDDYNKDVYNGFLTVGTGKGMSVPSTQKNPTYDRTLGLFKPFGPYAECELQTINGVQTYAQYNANGSVAPGYQALIDPRDGKELKGLLQFSDNPLLQLGNYIGVLATEWALLKRDNMSTANTERELYYALQAVDRLDLAGESLYAGTANSPSLNGFLMRNDADEMLQLNTTGKNIDLIKAPIACQYGPSECSESNATVKTGNAMSQDEVTGLLVGFALMRKMMPMTANYNGVGLRQWSIDITERLVNYVKKSGATNLWAIVDPDQKKRVCRGSKAWPNSFAMAKAAEYICGIPFHNFWSTTLGAAAWLSQKNLYATNSTDVFVGYAMPSIMQTALGFNQYEYIKIPGSYNIGHQNAYTVSMFLKLLAISKSGARPYPPFWDFTGKFTNNSISQTYQKHLYELLGSVISGYYPVLNETYWRTEFNKLNCGCNCMQGNNPNSWFGCQNFENNTIPPPGNTTQPSNPWAVEDRWEFHKYYSGSWPNTLNEYNGLDYMLAYNLYRYKYFVGGYSSRVRAYSYNKTFPFLSQPNPYDNNNQYLIGSSNYPIEAKAVFSISAFYNTILNSNANVKFTAGSNIRLLPGFKASSGAVFKATIKEYDCQPDIIAVANSSYVSLKNGSDSLVNSFFDYSIDTTIQVQLDEDSLDYLNEPVLDSNLYILVYTNQTDTFVYDLHPDYVYSAEGEIIHAPQGNKANLQPATLKSINLFPNPTNGFCYLEYMLYYNADIRIRVYNQLGQYFSGITDHEYYSQEKGQQKITLNTSSLSPGIYYCEFSIDGLRETKKFTVIK